MSAFRKLAQLHMEINTKTAKYFQKTPKYRITTFQAVTNQNKNLGNEINVKVKENFKAETYFCRNLFTTFQGRGMIRLRINDIQT